MSNKGDHDIKVLPIANSLYEKVVQGYWGWFLDHDEGLNNNIRKVNSSRIYLTRAGQTYSIGNAEYDFIFVPVLDTVEYRQANSPSGHPRSLEEINNILAHENNLVKATDMTVTVRKRVGQKWGPAVPLVSNIFDYRTSSPLNPNDTFQLIIPQNSSLANKMESPLTPGTSLDARAQGYYLLIEKPTDKEAYQISSKGLGLRNYRSIITITIGA